ncbi:SDR family NAD(P)-dependent oxidoreductase, partial [Mesorhizobium sp. M4B.F.Ca.ET.089.01.1.1]
MNEKIEHCVIIGGSSGIGLATARRLVGPAMKVTITGRNEDKLKDAWKSLGGTVGKAAFDATMPNEVRRFFDGLGPFDHLVLAASGGKGLG